MESNMEIQDNTVMETELETKFKIDIGTVVFIICSAIIVIIFTTQLRMNKAVDESAANHLAVSIENNKIISNNIAKQVSTWYTSITTELSTQVENISQSNDFSAETLNHTVEKALDNSDTINYYVGIVDKQLVDTDGVDLVWHYTTSIPFHTLAQDNDEIQLLKPVLDESSLEKDIAYSISKRIMQSDKLIGYMGADFKLDNIAQKIQNTECEEGTYNILVDNEGYVLAHTKERYRPNTDSIYNIDEIENGIFKELKKDYTGSRIMTFKDGLTRVISVSKVKETGWRVYTYNVFEK